MVSSNFIEPLAKGYLLMTNILSTVRIDKLSVPDVVASDCSAALLECMYGGAEDNVTVRWLLNGSQVYEWSQGREPSVSGLLEGRVDLSYRTSALQAVQQHTLRILAPTPELSGDYTCAVQSRGQDATMTKTMIVFSPEQEFQLTVSPAPAGAGAALAVKCVAKHLHPQPDLTIEYNKVPISQQQQHIWRFGAYYDAECTAVLSVPSSVTSVPSSVQSVPSSVQSVPSSVQSVPSSVQSVARARGFGEVACRLRIPLVDYTAITNKYVNIGKLDNSGCTIPQINLFLITFLMIFLTY